MRTNTTANAAQAAPAGTNPWREYLMNFLARWQAIVTKTVRGDQHNEATAAATDPKERPLMALLAHLEKVGTGAAFNFSPKFRSPELSRAVVALTTLVLLIQLFFTPQAVDAQGATRSLVESVKHWIATAQDLAQHTQSEFYASSYVSGVLDQLQAGGRLAALSPEDLRDIQVTIAPAAAGVTEVDVTLPPAINLRGSDGEGGMGGVYPSLETMQGALDEWASIQGDPSYKISHRYHYKVAGKNDAAELVTVVTTESGEVFVVLPDLRDNTVTVSDQAGKELLVTAPGGALVTPTPDSSPVAGEGLPPIQKENQLPALEMVANAVATLEAGGVTFVIDQSLGPDQFPSARGEPFTTIELRQDPTGETGAAETEIRYVLLHSCYTAWQHDQDDIFYDQRKDVDYQSWLEMWQNGSATFSFWAQSSNSENPASPNPKYRELVTVNSNTHFIIVFADKTSVFGGANSYQAQVEESSNTAQKVYIIANPTRGDISVRSYRSSVIFVNVLQILSLSSEALLRGSPFNGADSNRLINLSDQYISTLEDVLNSPFLVK